jgi:alkylresorcinol/alkylpyrone synthase
MGIAPRTMKRPAARTGKGAPILASLATAVPEHRIDQANAKALIGELFAESLGNGRSRLLEIFDHSGIAERHVCMPLEWYARPHTWAEANARYVEHGLALAEDVGRRALAGAALAPSDVDHVVFVSSTGIAAPSLDARLASRLGLRSDVRRTPIWGLGCAGGAAGLSRARDFASADEAAIVLVIALELCSLTFQRGDLDRRNLVATSLFSDGAAAAVVVGNARRPPAGHATAVPIELLASHSTLWPDTLDVMGWDVDERGLHVVFSRDVPTIVRQRIRPDLEGFLAEQGLALAEIDHLFTHPGGPKVLAAFAEALELPPDALRHSRDVLRAHGNMSSPTCLFVLERALAAGGLRSGERGVVAALGPGFASEYVLVRIAGVGSGRRT